MGIPGGTVVKNLPARAADTRGTGSIPGLERSPGEEHSSIPAFFPGKFYGQRRLVGYSTRDHKRPHGFPIEQNPHKQFVVNRQIFFGILSIIYQGSRWHGH